MPAAGKGGLVPGPTPADRGRPSEDVIVEEQGIRVGVRPWEGGDAGLFSDMRGLRAWLQPLAGAPRAEHLRVYGDVLVSAALGALAMLTVDLSEHYLDRAPDNFG